MAEDAVYEPTAGRVVRIVTAVTRAQDAQRKLTARARTRLGVGTTDIAALQYIARARDSRVTRTELADWLDVTGAAATMVCKRLVDAGYLQRVDDETDGRRRRLDLTSKGREAVDDAFGEADREATALVDLHDDSVVDSVVDTLEKLAAVLDRPTRERRAEQRPDG
jgi:DNA-binding MarR family transcriptional regulator